MKRFRTIVVDGAAYRWLYRYDDYDYLFYPFLLVVPASQPKAALRIHFPANGHFMLNSGFPGVLSGQKVSINLNRPVFVAELIRQAVKAGVNWERQKNWRLNGLELLAQLGYELNGV